MIVVVPIFMLPDIERMIHFVQKKWAARKVEKVCFSYLYLISCTRWTCLLTCAFIRKSAIAPRKCNRQHISLTHSFLSQPYMTSSICYTNLLLFCFRLSDPIWISRFQWHIHSFGYILWFIVLQTIALQLTTVYSYSPLSHLFALYGQASLDTTYMFVVDIYAIAIYLPCLTEFFVDHLYG